MKVLYLDQTFNLFGFKSIKHTLFKFSGGEIHIKLDPVSCYDVKKVIIIHRVINSDNIMEIALAKDALDRIGIKEVELFIPYLPYARQDRVCDFGESLSVKVFCSIVNSLNFTKVRILDVHSDVSLALLNNVINMDNYEYISLAYKSMKDKPHLVFPDAGAYKKYFRLTKLFRDSKYPIVCSKHRDVKDGKLSNFTIDKLPVKGNPCLIIDDICDGGRTFIGIAEELNKQGAGDIYLYTTHGIFSNGFKDLSNYFTKIYCTNSFKTIDPNNKLIKQFNINLNVQ